MDNSLPKTDSEIIDELAEDNVNSTSTVPKKIINFVNNKDLLKEIHKSKNSYSEFSDQKYADYDLIIDDINLINLDETIESAKIARATRLAAKLYESAITEAQLLNTAKPKSSEYKIDYNTIPVSDLVFRVLTFDHIPLAPGRKKTVKTITDKHAKLNFYPFKHFILVDGVATEVGRSHCKNGKFSTDHGSITNTFARMLILMVEKYAQRSNWRNYTYLEEMMGQAIVQLSQMALQFDEYKSDNPFGYFTMFMQNSFTRVFNLEKRNQEIRDDLLIGIGASPSFTRQLEISEEIRQLREEAQESIKNNK